jgi:hypothetical protein
LSTCRSRTWRFKKRFALSRSVDIHIAQEPGHEESSSLTLDQSLDENEQQLVVTSAEKMWRLWINFFESIRQEILPVDFQKERLAGVKG